MSEVTPDTDPDTGMGSDVPPDSTRVTPRARRMAIIGVIALVLVAGAVVVGVRTTGARSGALTTAALVCSYTGQITGTNTIKWTDTENRTGGNFYVELWQDGADWGATTGESYRVWNGAAKGKVVNGASANTTYSSMWQVLQSSGSHHWTFRVSYNPGTTGQPATGTGYPADKNCW